MVQKKPITSPEIKVIPDSAYVTVGIENVRQKPNGKILGKIRKGQKLYIEKKSVNWIQFHNQSFESAYIWAPSVGFEYINLYNPFTYFDTTSTLFYSTNYFKELLGSNGIRNQQVSEKCTLFFKELGLGSHEDIVLYVVTESNEKVEHGVTLFIHESNEKVFQVKVDFFRPIKGLSNALKKCGLGELPASETNEGHVLWSMNKLVPGLSIDMERKEWKSEWFSSIWFRSNDL
jgi:hypothetical protein